MFTGAEEGCELEGLLRGGIGTLLRVWLDGLLSSLLERKTNSSLIIWVQEEGVILTNFFSFLLENTVISGCGVLSITSGTGGQANELGKGALCCPRQVISDKFTALS